MVNYNHADYFGVKGIDYVNTETYDEGDVHIVRESTWYMNGLVVVKTKSSSPGKRPNIQTSYMKRGKNFAEPMTDEEAGQFMYDSFSFIDLGEGAIPGGANFVEKVPVESMDEKIDSLERTVKQDCTMRVLKTRNPKSVEVEGCPCAHALTEEFNEKYGPFEEVGKIELKPKV